MKENYKRWVLKTGVIFIAILLTLTFFSNTIYSIGLPCVTVDYAKSGVIRNTAAGEGFAEFMETKSYYAESRGHIELYVKEGDIIEEGTPLYSIYTDLDDLKNNLEVKRNEYDKTVLRIQKAANDKTYIQNALQSAEIIYEEPDFSAYDYEIESLRREIETITSELAVLEILLKSGAVSQSELSLKQRELERLNTSLEQTLLKRQQAADNASVAETASFKLYNEKIGNLNKSLDDTDYQLTEYILDKSRIEREIADINRQIENGGIDLVAAETGGRVINMVNTDSRNYVDANSLIIKLGITGANYYSILRFPENVDFIFVDDQITLEIKAKKLYNITGTAKEVYLDNGYLYVKTVFSADRINGGEAVSAKVEKASANFQNVIPNTAVRYDPREGYYMLYVEKVKSLFGYDYYARKIPINVQLQDIVNTAYFTISKEKYAIITNSDKVVSAGGRIRLVDGSDIIETR